MVDSCTLFTSISGNKIFVCEKGKWPSTLRCHNLARSIFFLFDVEYSAATHVVVCEDEVGEGMST